MSKLDLLKRTIA